MNQKKIIVYDFDKTLTKKDTLFGFFIFDAKKNIGFYFKVLCYFLFMILVKTSFISNRSLKNVGIKLFLSNLGKEQIRCKFLNYKSQISFNFLFKKDFKFFSSFKILFFIDHTIDVSVFDNGKNAKGPSSRKNCLAIEFFIDL